MPVLELETQINASREECFDRIREASGITAGKMTLGQTVTFASKRFGVSQQLTVKVVEFDRPRKFVDAMIEGRLKSFVHIHDFADVDGGTVMRDTLVWESPFGIFGKLFDVVILREHMRDLVAQRNARLKEIAEGNGS